MTRSHRVLLAALFATGSVAACKMANSRSAGSGVLDSSNGAEEPEACFDARLMEIHNGLINARGSERDVAKGAGFPMSVPLAADDGNTPAVGTAFLSKDMRKIVVAFRGTTTGVDVLMDLMFLPALRQGDGTVLHEGFNLVAKGYESSVKAAIAELKRRAKDRGKSPRVVLSGHSLGGAVAVLVADRLNRGGVDVDEVVLFGTPRVGYRFRPVYRLLPNTRHYFVRFDPVPNVPPAEIGYEDLPARSIQMILPGTERESASERLTSIVPDVLGKTLDLFGDVARESWTGAGALLNGESPTINVNFKGYADPLMNKYITRHFPHVYVKMVDGLCATPEKIERDQWIVRSVHVDLYRIFPQDDELRDLVAAFRAARAEGYADWYEHEMLTEKYKTHFVKKAYEELHGKPAPAQDVERMVAKLRTKEDFAQVEEGLGASPEPLGSALVKWLEHHVGPMREPNVRALGEKALAKKYKLWEFRPRRGGYYFDRDGLLRFIYEEQDVHRTWVHWKQLLLKYDFDRLPESEQAKADDDAVKLLRAIKVVNPAPKGGSPWREALTETLCAMMCDKAAFDKTIWNAYALYGYTAVGESTFAKFPRTCEAGNIHWTEGREGKPVEVGAYLTEGEDEPDETSQGTNGQEFATLLMSNRALSRHSAALLVRGCGGVLFLHDELFHQVVKQVAKDEDRPAPEGGFRPPDP